MALYTPPTIQSTAMCSGRIASPHTKSSWGCQFSTHGPLAHQTFQALPKQRATNDSNRQTLETYCSTLVSCPNPQSQGVPSPRNVISHFAMIFTIQSPSPGGLALWTWRPCLGCLGNKLANVAFTRRRRNEQPTIAFCKPAGHQ